MNLEIRRNIIRGANLALVLVLVWILIPPELPSYDYSKVLFDAGNQVLAAKVASDGQWRFYRDGDVPEKFEKCILTFEDKYFYAHPGVNPVSILFAAIDNLKAGRIVRGGSTLSMQSVRLSRRKERTYLEKTIELALAVKLDLHFSKSEILSLYASMAPFGGNVVGLEAASWRYYNRSPDELSWAESATLAVLPNNPSIIYPGRNDERLLRKRNRLLKALLAEGVIQQEVYSLALEEPIPKRPLPIPQYSYHLLNDLQNGSALHSTLDKDLIAAIENAIFPQLKQLQANDIKNVSYLVATVDDGEVIAYNGNLTGGGSDPSHRYVDIGRSPRSTGSILKPFLYASLLDEAIMSPKQIVPDIPTFVDGFAPTNFDKTYKGAVQADRALAASLNIPAVFMLRQYSYQKFHDKLQHIGFTTFMENPSYYGLSLILGGGEANLWELSSAYASMARVLNRFNDAKGEQRYAKNEFYKLRINKSTKQVRKASSSPQVYSAGAIWQTLEAITTVSRPEEDQYWKQLSSSRKIAWKTGTSYGHRDAWAIGVTPEYVVGVWVGNADGQGKTGLTGVVAAAPIMFEIFSQIPGTSWFDKPVAELRHLRTCSSSGMKANSNCKEVVLSIVPKQTLATDLCSFCHLIYTTPNSQYQVNTSCFSWDSLSPQPYFVLSPVQAYYYKKWNGSYREKPPMHPLCRTQSDQTRNIELIYPYRNAEVFVPRKIDGRPSKLILEASHNVKGAKLFWHLNQDFIGETEDEHRISIYIGPGKYTLSLVDEFGEQVNSAFIILQPEV